MKRLRLLALAWPLLAAVSSAAAAEPVRLTDAVGRVVEIARPPERIVPIFASNTELVAALGLADRVVGIEAYTRYPPEVLDRPRVGGRLGFSVDAIVAQRPELLIVTPSRQAMHLLIEPMTRLRKIARESGASAMERLMAESGAWKVHKEFIELMQSLGHLPKAATGVVADIYQHGSVDPIASYDAMAQRIHQLELNDAQTGYGDPHRAAKLSVLLDEMNRGKLAAQLERVSQITATAASSAESSAEVAL